MLAWHVDYWDHLGWKDPFGRAEFTERQKRYKAARGLEVHGTPHFFVNNESYWGRRGLREAIRAAAHAEEPARVAIEATAVAKEGAVHVEVRLSKLDPRLELTKAAETLVVLYQKRAVTECEAGENKGKTLEEWFVVRAAKALPAGFEKAVARFPLPRGLDASGAGVAVLVEERAQMRTLQCKDVPVEG